MHAHQFWWAWSLRFWRYGYLSKTAKFPFRPMNYSPWSSKNLINRNRPKKFMQVGIDVKFMHTNFVGCYLSSFGDIATFQKLPIFPFGAWTIILIDQNWPKKFMQVGIDVKCMHTNFGGRGLSSFGDMATFQKRPNFPFDPWTIVHGHQKI